ncbi:sodium:solute symporter family protein [Aquifex aeolicus]|uniref:Na(+):solute symporter (Ssf family) n=1 Tax=Aquifex aeolicus (strain VF5) TaxID=224324 RepID=O67873_AQUAE|nr:sodium:solute symporter family protein [Aquifex aeolicus]AAC07841.1 Na(+):solute symporter (Ssf family) [Aquifex aeolicus VF5]
MPLPSSVWRSTLRPRVRRLAYIMGWTGGYVLLALLIAPYLRKFGKFTVPDFIAERYESNFARLVALIIAIIISFTYMVGQVAGVGIIMGRLFGVPFEIGIAIGMIVIIATTVLGGMKSITWTQVAQYIVLITAYLLPVSLLAMQWFGIPLPQFLYGNVLQWIVDLEKQHGISPHYIEPYVKFNMIQFLALMFVLMAGTAALPHVLMRFFTTPSVKDARWSAGWALFFIAILYLTAPAYAAFARYVVLKDVVGKPIDQLPAWAQKWAETGLFKVIDQNGDGIIQWAELQLHRDIVVLATPEIAGLSLLVGYFVMAGGLAAALSTADGLLLVIAAAVSNDLYAKMINPNAPEKKIVMLGKIAVAVAGVIGGFVAAMKIGFIVQIVAWAFSLATASFFPALVLGIFWKRLNKEGAIAGMVAGLLVTIIYIYLNKTQGFSILGIQHTASGVFGLLVNLIVSYIVTMMTPPPSERVQKLVEDIRYPKKIHEV